MSKRTDTFDCVAMKDRIQGEIMAEYEARKGGFPSFAAFLRATSSDWEREARETLQTGAEQS